MKFFAKLLVLMIVFVTMLLGQVQAVDMHPLESYSAFYDHDGELAGKGAIYCRDHCNQQVLVMDLKSKSVDLLDFKIRVIGGGAVEKSVDFIGNTITDLPDKNYENNVKFAKQHGAVAAIKNVMTGFGAVETDEVGNFNGYACRYWEQKTFGVKLCFDENMILVYRHNDYLGKVSSQTLTKLIVGNGGADGLYVVPEGLRVIK